MSDIVERLDKMIATGIYPQEVREARDYIAQLRSANTAMNDEIERLRESANETPRRT